MFERRCIDGTWYVSHELLTTGSGGSAGMVGEANIRTLEGLEGARVEKGAFNFKQLWLPDTDENVDVIRGFDRYPVMDDEVLCQVESDWEGEAWERRLRSDLVKTLPYEMRDAALWLDNQGKEDDEEERSSLFNCYREAMASTGSQLVHESDGLAVDVAGISQAFHTHTAFALLCLALEQAPRLGLGEMGILSDVPFCVLADRLEEDGHELAEFVRYLWETRQQTAAS